MRLIAYALEEKHDFFGKRDKRHRHLSCFSIEFFVSFSESGNRKCARVAKECASDCKNCIELGFAAINQEKIG